MTNTAANPTPSRFSGRSLRLAASVLFCVLALVGASCSPSGTSGKMVASGHNQLSTEWKQLLTRLFTTIATPPVKKASTTTTRIEPASTTTTWAPPATATTVAPAGGVAPPTTTPASSPSIGAPVDAGLTVPVSSLKTWTGPTTITPTTPGVVNGVLSGYLFTSGPIYVSGNVTISNSRFAFQDYWHIIVQGTSTPGPVFSHIEIDGENMAVDDDDGITNSSRDNGGVQGVTVSPFTLDSSHIENVSKGMRLDSGATVTNTLINHLQLWGDSHTDGTEIYCGSHIVIDHTTIDDTWPGGPNTGAPTNGATEIQGDTADGGFCPVSYLTITNDLFSGGGATFRMDDSKITHVTVQNVTIVAGSYVWFAATNNNPAGIDSWVNVKLSDGTVIPRPTGSEWQFGCHAIDVSCPA